VDLWGLMFDRKDRGFSEDKGTTRNITHLSVK
jgi:hypothetical protein